ncbi:helix-turn-helix domain-containing protein [Paractinoplanes lichenicola]|uniref:helix-turn-helix domain-containing protein n=1 Tax=Paractinoplanes lichenicola TaxID=2802976 RepID=UPI001F317A16|nr:helix-turn-helix domain-containing protein [Actinoplanes lichenicola]
MTDGLSARTRRPRADARRNAERLLAAAEAAFREQGVEAPLEQIARRAGVAIGTLYGHFPNRRALLGALLRERNDALFAVGDRLLGKESALLDEESRLLSEESPRLGEEVQHATQRRPGEEVQDAAGRRPGGKVQDATRRPLGEKSQGAAGRRLGKEGHDVAERLAAWVRAVVEHAAAYSGLAGVLVEGFGDEASELHASCVRMESIGEALVAEARDAGAIRAEVTGEDVFALMNSAAWLREHESVERADRLVAFTIAGMRT